ncbi:MAG TPA: SDR family NAD(P)-dependent oxidoreductase, partial [Cyclobacteriaceae bacterium]|nr:SDR family NAD(P)-dependent oxidoreductase [Cyclobacteriaceae bacterium]
MSKQNLFDLTGKRALITGGTHGLGMSMAKGLGHAGATLVINGHTKDKMDQALAEYSKEGLNAYGYLFDVTNEAAVAQSIEKIENEVGAIDIVVNNAGIIVRTPLLDLSVEDFRKVVDIDLTGP